MRPYISFAGSPRRSRAIGVTKPRSLAPQEDVGKRRFGKLRLSKINQLHIPIRAKSAEVDTLLWLWKKARSGFLTLIPTFSRREKESIDLLQ